MPRIQLLAPEVAARIAAGEVIERPASVFKELAENSIDAGCTRLECDVGQGGTEYLTVRDDGGGIEPDDLALAFATHATSKLRSADDLTGIGTLGFRGEGLASIGAVARVLLQSRPAGADAGAEIRCDGGLVSGFRPWNGAQGTRVEVRHLFYSVPARRKFLRAPSAEMAHVAEAFARLALSRLGLHLTLRHNGRVVHDIPASAGLLDRTELLLGGDVRKALKPVEAEQEGMTLAGYAADPTCERSSGQGQYLFVNGRWVRDRALSAALQEAYRGLLMTGRHPVALLFLDLPPDAVDVNVHPAKTEVRFRRPAEVSALVREAVAKALSKRELGTAMKLSPPPSPEPELPLVVEAIAPRPARAPVPEGERRGVSPPWAQQSLHAAPIAERDADGGLGATTDSHGGLTPRRSPVRAVQMHDLYIVAEVPEGVLLLDQHALHERILFEQLRERFEAGRLDVQKLLVPETVHLSPADAALVVAHRGRLAELGLEVEGFGGGTVLLSGYPAALGRHAPRDILRGVAAHLAAQEGPPPRDVLLDGLMALLACHAAVRAGERLPPELVRELADQHATAKNSHHCPHGRPSSLLLSRADLSRQFGRT